jgi:hypothetical protein
MTKAARRKCFECGIQSEYRRRERGSRDGSTQSVLFEITCRDPLDGRYPDGRCVHVSIESSRVEKEDCEKKRKEKGNIYYWLLNGCPLGR